MALVVCGINHRTAPLNVREQIVFPAEHMEASLRTLIANGVASEAMILSTCNRTEVICKTMQSDNIIAWLNRYQAKDLQPYLYLHRDKDAVHHLLRVASGLDSMLLGEPQILGQMKAAFSLANLAGVIGSYLHRLFQYIFAAAKQVRASTEIGVNPVSLAYVTIHLAKKIFADLSQRSVLLIGAGATIELLAQHLQEQGVHQYIIANRTLARAQALAERYRGIALELDAITEYLSKADLVMTATSSPLPLLGKGSVESAIKQRKHKPMLMVDLAVPRNIESEVNSLEDVYLYTLDDLHRYIQQNWQRRQDAASQAEQLILWQAEHFMRQLRSLESVDTIRAYRDKVTVISDRELERAYQALQRGEEPQQIIKSLAHNLSHKIMHGPCTRLRQAAYDGRFEVISLAQQLFDL